MNNKVKSWFYVLSCLGNLIDTISLRVHEPDVKSCDRYFDYNFEGECRHIITNFGTMQKMNTIPEWRLFGSIDEIKVFILFATVYLCQTLAVYDFESYIFNFQSIDFYKKTRDNVERKQAFSFCIIPLT